MKAFALLLAALALAWTVALSARAGPPPSHIVVVTDDRYPPYLFRGDDGELQAEEGEVGRMVARDRRSRGVTRHPLVRRGRKCRESRRDRPLAIPRRAMRPIFRPTARRKRASISRSRWAASTTWAACAACWWAPGERLRRRLARTARNLRTYPDSRRWSPQRSTVKCASSAWMRRRRLPALPPGRGRAVPRILRSCHPLDRAPGTRS